MESYIISVLVHNQPGVLSRVSGLFNRRGFNIESLAVGTTHVEGISRMTIVVPGTLRTVEQMAAQIRKLMCVTLVKILPAGNVIAREMLLIKVRCGKENRDAVARIVDIFRARIVDVNRNCMTVEITGEEKKNAAFLELMGDFGILEIVRTGTVALEQGEGYLRAASEE